MFAAVLMLTVFIVHMIYTYVFLGRDPGFGAKAELRLTIYVAPASALPLPAHPLILSRFCHTRLFSSFFLKIIVHIYVCAVREIRSGAPVQWE